MTVAVLIMIRGNSGSGKTSVALALQSRLGENTMRISQDAVRREMLKAKDGKDTAAQPLMQMLVKYGGEHCRHVILEGILNADWYRPLFETAKAVFDERILAYYYDLSFEETVKRHATRAKSGEFGADDMRRWWNEKDYTDVIAEETLTGEMSLEETVEKICGDIRAMEKDAQR